MVKSYKSNPKKSKTAGSTPAQKYDSYVRKCERKDKRPISYKKWLTKYTNLTRARRALVNPHNDAESEPLYHGLPFRDIMDDLSLMLKDFHISDSSSDD